MKAAYAQHGVRYDQHILIGAGHGADSTPVTLPNGTNQTQLVRRSLFLVVLVCVADEGGRAACVCVWWWRGLL